MAAVWPAGPEPMITSRECMLLEFIFEVVVRPEEESPAVDDTRWLCEAAAATGTENNDRKRGDAFLKAEANTLATSADSRANSVVCCAGMENGGWDVCRIYTRRAGASRQEASTTQMTQKVSDRAIGMIG